MFVVPPELKRKVIPFLFRLFMEILNDCTDVDEIKFQEDGTWCPMRPKKEALKVSSPHIPKVESKETTHVLAVITNIHSIK